MGNDRKASSGKPIRKRRRKKKKSGSCLILLIVFIIVAGCSGYVAWYLFMPSNDYEDFHTYYNLPPDEIAVVLRDVRLDLPDKPVEYNGSVCFPVDFVKNYIDPYIYWDENIQKLTVTMPDKVLRFIPGQSGYYKNNKPAAADAPVYMIDKKPYMPAELLTQVYHVSLGFHTDNNIVVLNYLGEDRETGAIISENAALRFLPDKKAPLMYRFSNNEKIYVFGVEADYTRVRTENGLVGYVLTRQMTDTGPEKGIPEDAPAEFPALPPIQGKVNLVWDQVTRAEGNANSMGRTIEDGLDVISPTWFSFDMNLSGDILSIADADYVNWAHDHGCQVWALINDFSRNTDVVYNMEISQSILPDTDKRQHVIDQLMSLISEYNLDGVNIDFEWVQRNDADAYVQFFRELYPYMRAAGKVLSVDVPAPRADKYWPEYYNLAELGKSADYICVMAYDEFNASSKISGPCASMPYVRDGVEITLKDVPKEKVLMGLPYYTWVWKEETADGAAAVTSCRSYDMDGAYRLFKDNNATVTWDSAYGLNYATFTDSEGAVYKTWLEDEQSVREKLQYMRSMGLAGVAGWRWGLESSVVWDLLRQYVN